MDGWGGRGGRHASPDIHGTPHSDIVSCTHEEALQHGQSDADSLSFSGASCMYAITLVMSSSASMAFNILLYFLNSFDLLSLIWYSYQYLYEMILFS